MLTRRVRPIHSTLSALVMAYSASSFDPKVTKPKPRDRPEERSKREIETHPNMRASLVAAIRRDARRCHHSSLGASNFSTLPKRPSQSWTLPIASSETDHANERLLTARKFSTIIGSISSPVRTSRSTLHEMKTRACARTGVAGRESLGSRYQTRVISVHHDSGILDLAVRGEVLPQVLALALEAEVADVKLASLAATSSAKASAATS